MACRQTCTDEGHQRQWLHLVVGSQHNLENFFFQICKFGSHWTVHLATCNKDKMVKHHTSSETELEFCWPHSMVKHPNCGFSMDFLTICCLLSSSNNQPNHSNTADQLHHDCKLRLFTKILNFQYF